MKSEKIALLKVQKAKRLQIFNGEKRKDRKIRAAKVKKNRTFGEAKGKIIIFRNKPAKNCRFVYKNGQNQKRKDSPDLCKSEKIAEILLKAKRSLN